METTTKQIMQKGRRELILMSLELLYARVDSLRNLSFEMQATILNAEFDVDTTGRELFMLHEPTVEEETVDVQLNTYITNGANI